MKIERRNLLRPDKSKRASKEQWKNPQCLQSTTVELRLSKQMITTSSDEKFFNRNSKKNTRHYEVKSPGVSLKGFTNVQNINFSKLVATTHFNSLEVAILMEIFSCLATRNSKPKIMTQFLETSVVRQFLCDNFQITNENTLYHVTRTIANGQLNISATDFVRSMSVILRGNLKERAKFVFQTYDEDKNGVLMKAIEFSHLMVDLFDVNISADNPTVDPEQPTRETMEYLLRKFDVVKRNEVCFDDFFRVIQAEPMLLECLFPVFPSEERINAFEHIYLYPSEGRRFLS